MNRLKSKEQNAMRRANRVRSTIKGTAIRPRLTVFISNQHVSAQVIDDDKNSTLVSATSVGQAKLAANLTEKAKWVGTEVAKSAKTKKIKKIVLDRGPRLYHGRIKALADAARTEGLEF
jgi:large subunit ribosomal protein L18